MLNSRNLTIAPWALAVGQDLLDSQQFLTSAFKERESFSHRASLIRNIDNLVAKLTPGLPFFILAK